MLAILLAPVVAEAVGEVFDQSPTVFVGRLLWEIFTGED